MEALTKILFDVSGAMLVPVVVGLLGLLAVVLLALGSFLREALDRHRRGADKPALAARSSSESEGALPPELVASARSLRGKSRDLQILLDDAEVESAAKLSRLLLGARVGPMLGLMGTLIPLGPALIGLAQGRLEELAANLVVAFSTTIVGLFVGGLCYSMMHARKLWYARDLVRLEALCERLAEESPA